MDTVGNININFRVFSDSPQEITIADFSEWIYAEDKPAFLEITMPGSSKVKTFSFNKRQFNGYNSNNLGLSCLTADCKEEKYTDLPDGIYTISLLSSYENQSKLKYYLKTDRYEIEFSKVMIKYGLEITTPDFLRYMVETDGILKVAKSHTMLGDFTKAQKFFEEAKSRLNKYNECQNCK